jgi:hypothetical protein
MHFDCRYYSDIRVIKNVEHLITSGNSETGFANSS